MFPHTPGMRSILNNNTIKKEIEETLHSGTSPVLLLETTNRQETEPFSLKKDQVSIQLKANWTLLSFMGQLLLSLRRIDPCFNYTITDVWMSEKDENSVRKIVNGFISALSKIEQPVLLFLYQVDNLTEGPLLDFLLLLAEQFPNPHNFILSGHSIVCQFKEIPHISHKKLNTSLPCIEQKSNFALDREVNVGNEALSNKDIESLKQALIHSHQSLIRHGRTWAMHAWVFLLEKEISSPDAELSAAIGAYYTATAQYDQAEHCLKQALKEAELGSPLHTQATLTHAQLIRQTVSCDSANNLLDPMIFELEDLSTETAYFWLAEKIHNLLLEEKWIKADELVRNLVTICDIAENPRIKKWYERAMVPISYHYGNLKETIQHYEQSLTLPEDEQFIVQERNVDTYAAQAYFAIGETEKALTLLEDSIQKLKDEGRIHELQSHYAALGELYFWKSLRTDGNEKENFVHASAEAIRLSGVFGHLICPSEKNRKKMKEYATLYTFMTGNASAEKKETLLEMFAKSSPPFNLFLLNALTLDALKKQNYQEALYYGMYAIEVGEISKQKLETATSYGLAANAALRLEDAGQAAFLIRRFLVVSSQTGLKHLFHIPDLSDPILQFAEKNGIEPIIVSEIKTYLSV